MFAFKITPQPAEETVRAKFRRACSALRRGNVELAQTIIEQAGDEGKSDARILNLMGALALQSSDWKQARKRWRQALRVDRQCGPAKRNLRRYYELYALGYSQDALALGDEPEFAWGQD